MQAKKEPEDMPSNPFTLTMLGTDTVYTPALKTKNMPQKGSYPKGETLSIISSQIKTQTPPEIDPTNKSVYPYKADEITVINGPTTLGTEVGDRIGRGVAAILKAITQGKKPINIIAHSRGAVESLLIAHEINELQNHIQNCSTMESLVEYVEAQQKQRKKKSSTPDIVKALNEELKKTTQPEEFLKSLKTHFSSCTLNLFAIDPVPGDVSPITWYDERFYIIPGIIKNAEFIFYENERSDWGFTPIFPDLSDPEQNITYLSMPGHHGTGSSGSNLSQQKKRVGPKDKKSTHVQKLIIFKLIDFLSKQGVVFQDLEIFKEGRGLGRKKISRTEEDQFNFPAIYRQLYAKIMAHRPAYQAFNKTHYEFMGLLKDDRRILKQGKYTNFQETFFTGHGYVNEEHGLLMQEYFFEKLGNSSIENTSLDALVNNAAQLLVSNIQDANSNNTTAEPELKMVSSWNGSVSPLLVDSEVRKDILWAFGGLVSRVSQKYLTSDWSSKEKQSEKLNLLNAIRKMLSDLNQFVQVDNEQMAKFSEELLQKIIQGIEDTVQQQSEHLYTELNRLCTDTDEQLKTMISDVVFQLENKESGVETEPFVSAIFQNESFPRQKSATINEKIQYIRSQLKDRFNEKALEPYSEERLETLFKERFEEKFEDYERVSHQIEVFADDLNALTSLDASKNPIFQNLELNIRKQQDRLVTSAAKKFYSNQKIDSKETLLKENFQGKVARYAIQHFDAVDPNKTERQNREKELNNQDEANYLSLINKKLIPLTDMYLEHLDKVKKDDRFAKREKVAQLKDCLTNVERHYKPSDRVTNFYTTLNRFEQELKQHRDPAWNRYVLTAIIVAGILITGILPGLLALAAYTQMGNKAGKSPLFWRSYSDTIIEDLKKDALDANPEHPEKPR